MSVLNRTPTNVSLLSPASAFKVIVNRLPHVMFFLQEVNMPGIHTDAVPSGNPFTAIPQVPDHLEFEPLELSFKIDENMDAYCELVNWIYEITSPTGTEQYATAFKLPQQSGLRLVSDISLLIMNNTKGKIAREVTFVDAFPISLSGFKLASNVSDIEYPSATVTFAYNYYKFANVSALTTTL